MWGREGEASKTSSVNISLWSLQVTDGGVKEMGLELGEP